MSDNSGQHTGGTERQIKKCKICSKPFAIYEQSDWGTVITHYEREHPDSDLAKRTVENQYIKTVCNGCDTEFVGKLHWSEDHLTVDAYCGECDERVETAIKDFDLRQDPTVFSQVECDCHTTWETVLEEETSFCQPLTR